MASARGYMETPKKTKNTRRRLVLILLPLLLLLAGLAALTWTLLPGDDTDRTTVTKAVGDFRHELREDAVPDHAKEGFPPIGVYRYRTHGGEDLQAGFVRSGHDFGGVSTISVIPSSCGVAEQWQVFETRWSRANSCNAGTHTGLRTLDEYREFFDRPKITSYRCTGERTPPWPSLQPGMKWARNCVGKDGAISNRSQVLALGTVQIEGRRIDSAHIRTRALLSGESSGASIQDDWRRLSDGLLLRRRMKTESSFDFFGGGTYGEDFRLLLLETNPKY